MATRQPEQQQRGALSRSYPCPTCKQSMRLVGVEDAAGSGARPSELFTFQCRCGQVIATLMQ